MVASEDAVQTVEIQQSVVAGQVAGSGRMEAVTIALSEDDVPLASLSRKLRVKWRRKEESRKKEENFSQEGHPNPVPASRGNGGE